MADQEIPVSTGVDAQQSVVANSIESIVDDAFKEGAQEKPEVTEEQAKPDGDELKQLSPAEELEKLRRAKARDDRRIGRLTAQKYQAIKEADDLRAKLTGPQQNSQQGGELSVAKTGIPTKLNPNSFANYSDFIEARAEEIADYKIDKKFAEHTAKQQQQFQTQRESAWEAERMETVDKLGDDFVKEVPDAASVINQHQNTIQKFSDELKRAILKINNPPLALYNLAKDDMLEDLADMSIEDARVELRLAERKEAVKPKTKAPTPLPAARGSVAGGKRPEDLSGDEIRSWLRSE